MASQSRRRRGRATEHVVAEYFAQFWSEARVVNSGASGSDILGLPFDVEIKARAGFNPKKCHKQTLRRMIYISIKLNISSILNSLHL